MMATKPVFKMLNLCAELLPKKISLVLKSTSQESSMDIVTGYGLGGRGSIPGKGKIFLLPQRPDRLWCPPILLCSWYGGSLPKVKAVGA
jgi:hypothetical protein